MSMRTRITLVTAAVGAAIVALAPFAAAMTHN